MTGGKTALKKKDNTWVCSECGTVNGEEFDICFSCGATRRHIQEPAAAPKKQRKITEKREKKAPIINLKTRQIKKGNANLTTEVEDDEVDIAEEIGQEVLKETNPTETLVETAEIEEADEIPVETPTTNYIDDLFKDLE